ncbi:MAG TPA: DUF11 domain-containing protein [Pirellulales bacterium]|nr:DUF11 domain-containing protein [Pirellulales bacterium]
MKFREYRTKQGLTWSTWWRWTMVAAGAIVLCSCRTSARPIAPSTSSGDIPLANTVANDLSIPTNGSLPPTAWSGQYPPGCRQWTPPGISQPWPKDEYICDGGDHGRPIRIDSDWTVRGIQMEDTIAHFDTLDGRTLVKPSNKVCIYAPRFGSVRSVLGADGFEGKESLVRHDIPTRIAIEEEMLLANTTLQQTQTDRAVGSKRIAAQQLNAPGLQIANDLGLIEAHGGEKPYENLLSLQDGMYEQAELAKLAMRTEAAAIWTIDKGVQVILDGTAAKIATGDARAQATYTIDHESKPNLRIIKVASADVAQPGQIIEFTLQFENIGNEPIGNVTIIDNLTTRLEYVPDSETSSLAADFITTRNEGDSLILRWEITDPVPPREGSTIHFKCRVR